MCYKITLVHVFSLLQVIVLHVFFVYFVPRNVLRLVRQNKRFFRARFSMCLVLTADGELLMRQISSSEAEFFLGWK